MNHLGVAGPDRAAIKNLAVLSAVPVRNAYARSVAMFMIRKPSKSCWSNAVVALKCIVAAKFIIRKSFRIVMDPTVCMERKFIN